MAVLPISGVRVNNTNTRLTSFKGLNIKGNEEVSKPRKSNKLASVPVALLIAMTPAMMNGNEPVKAIPIDNENLTELLAYAAPSESTVAESQITASGTSAPYGFTMLNHKKIFKTINATVKGEPATLILAGEKKINGSTNNNEVMNIYYIPKKNDYPKNTFDLPEVQSLVYHNIGKEKEFCGLELKIPIFNNGKTMGYLYREARIDDDTANYLIDFIVEDTPYKNSTFPNFHFKETNSAELSRIRSTKL